MKDAIDIRNDKERFARSIVKRRNIMYMTREQAQMHRDREDAEVVIEQLLSENDRKSAAMIEQLLAEQEMLQAQLYTGMDATGTAPMTQENQSRIEAILNEKNKQLQDLIATHSPETAKTDTALDQAFPEGAGAYRSPAEEGASGNGAPPMAEGLEEDDPGLPNMNAVLQEIGGA